MNAKKSTSATPRFTNWKGRSSLPACIVFSIAVSSEAGEARSRFQGSNINASSFLHEMSYVSLLEQDATSGEDRGRHPVSVATRMEIDSRSNLVVQAHISEAIWGDLNVEKVCLSYQSTVDDTAGDQDFVTVTAETLSDSRLVVVREGVKKLTLDFAVRKTGKDTQCEDDSSDALATRRVSVVVKTFRFVGPPNFTDAIAVLGETKLPNAETQSLVWGINVFFQGDYRGHWLLRIPHFVGLNASSPNMIPGKDAEISVGIVGCEPYSRAICVGYGWNVTPDTKLKDNQWIFFTVSGIEFAKLLNR